MIPDAAASPIVVPLKSKVFLVFFSRLSPSFFRLSTTAEPRQFELVNPRTTADRRKSFSKNSAMYSFSKPNADKRSTKFHKLDFCFGHANDMFAFENWRMQRQAKKCKLRCYGGKRMQGIKMCIHLFQLKLTLISGIIRCAFTLQVTSHTPSRSSILSLPC